MKMPDHNAYMRALLLGMGFDHDDGHLRVTRGENFYLVGGSERTHATMQEKTLHFNDELSARCKRLEDLSYEEMLEIARKARMIRGG